MSKLFEQKLSQLFIKLSDTQVQQFNDYYHLLIEWNKVMNLTGITDYEEVYEKHFIDSLSIVQAVNLKDIKSLIDIGTGAGFPGIPIKIVYPHVEVVLLDSLNKRINFLNEVIQKLQLENIQAIHSRAEDAARKIELRGQFDICTSRAVANLSTLSEYCIPFIKTKGTFISYKAGEVEDEIEQSKRAIEKLGAKIDSIKKFNLPNSEISRSLIVIKKIRETNKKYPRKAGLPGREPL